MHFCRIFILSFLFCLGTLVCTAAEISSVHIGKVQIDWPEAKLYFTLLDSLGRPEQNTIPSEFTAIIGTDRAEVKEIKPFTATEEGIAYTLLVENSRSISPEDFAKMQTMVTTIVTGMSPKDQACILTFGREANLIQNFTGNKEILKEKLAALAQTEESPRLYESLTAALQAARTPDKSIPARRAVIMTADGTNDSTASMTKQEVLENLRHEPLPIYVIGLFNPALADNEQIGLNALNELTHYSGGALYQSRSATVSAISNDLFTASRGGFIAYLICPPLQENGLYKVQLAIQNGDKLFTDTIESQIAPGAASAALAPQKTAEPERTPCLWLPFVYLPLVLLGFSLVAWQLYKHKKKPTSTDAGRELPPDASIAYKQAAATTTRKEQQVSQYCPPPQPVSPHCLNLLLTTLTPLPKTFTLYLADTITVGSDAPSHLILKNDKDISTLHCKLSQQNSKLYITDLGSVHGTFVNNIPIKTRIQLQDGDVILIGQTELQVIF